MSLKNAVITLLILVILIVGFVYLSSSLGLAPFKGIGLLFLLCFAGIMKLTNIKNAICGGLLGIAIPYICMLAATNLGTIGTIIAIVLPLVVLLLYLMGKLPIVINNVTLVYVMVISKIFSQPITTVINTFLVTQYYKTFVLGVVYFTIAYLIYGKIMSKKQCKDS